MYGKFVRMLVFFLLYIEDVILKLNYIKCIILILNTDYDQYNCIYQTLKNKISELTIHCKVILLNCVCVRNCTCLVKFSSPNNFI